MTTQNLDDLSSSDDLGEDTEQVVGTQDTSQPTEQPTGGQDSESFMEVDRESLTPEEKTRFDSMNSAFTQRMQSLAETQRELNTRRSHADLGALVAENSTINRLVFDAVNRLQSGQPIETLPSDQPPLQSPGTAEMSPEETAANELVERAMERVLGKVIPQMTQQISEVTSYVRNNQMQTEYEVLCAKYPNAKSVSQMQLQSKQLQYQRRDGTQISLEEAYDLMAGQNPGLLTAQPGQPPGTPPGRKPAVEPGKGGGVTTPLASVGALQSAFEKIKGLAKKNTADGVDGLQHATNRARQRFSQEHPNSIP